MHMLQGQLIGKGAVFVSMMMMSRYLGDLWFGRLLLAVVLSVFSCFITDFGTAILVNRRVSLDSAGRSRELWRSALGFRTATALFSIAALTVFSLASYPAAQTFMLLPILLGVTLEIMSELPFACFRATGRTVLEARARIWSSAVFLLAVAFSIRINAHAYVLALTFLLRGLVMAIGSFAAARAMGFDIVPGFDRRRLLGLLGETWPLGLMGLVAILHQRVDNLVIERVLGVESVGAYNEIFKVVEVLVLIVTPTLLPGALFPGLCRAFRDGCEQAAMRRIAFLIGALSAVVTALVLPPGQLFMRFLWGGAFLRGMDPMAFSRTRLLLLAGIPVFYFMNFLLAAVIASGRQKATLPAVSAGFAVSLVLNFLLVIRIGLPGSGVAAVASSGVVALVCALVLGRAATGTLAVPVLCAFLPAAGILLLQGSTGIPWPLLTVAGLALSVPATLMAHRAGWSVSSRNP